MPHVKHFKEISLRSGKSVYAFNPSLTLRKKLGVCYEQYNCREDAIARALEAAEDFAQLKRTGRVNTTQAAYTVNGLVDAYKLTAGWRKIARKENSRRAYESSLKTALCVPMSNGKLLKDSLFANVKPLQAELLYSDLCHHKGVTVANQAIKVLGVVWSAAIRLELTSSNPFSKLDLECLHSSTMVWSSDQVSRFVDMADQMALSSVGTIVMMAYDLCQRPGDCRQMRWSNFNVLTQDAIFDFVQEKTGTPVQVPSTERLTHRLSALQRQSNCNPNAPIVLYEKTDKPYGERLYRKKAELVRHAAGLHPSLKVYGLRSSGATEMGDAACTEDEIRAVTGHKSRQILNTYVQPTRTMAQSAQAKRQAMNS